MAFSIRNLSVLTFANGFTLWHYKAGQDALAAVNEPGFFTEAVDMLTPGDMIVVSSPDGCSLRSFTPASPIVGTVPVT